MAVEIKLLTKDKPKNSRNPDDPIVYDLSRDKLSVYLGKDFDAAKLRKLVSQIDWKQVNDKEVLLDAANLSRDLVELVYEIIKLKSYNFEAYKTSSKHKQVEKVRIKKQQLSFASRDKLLKQVLYCRDIVSSNASEVNPGYFEKQAKAIARTNSRISVKVIDAAEAKRKGMDCLLAVGHESLKNSAAEFHPRLLVMEYSPPRFNPKTQEHIALVGKGITFDTGGLCLKPTKYMLDMKSDMAGAATVLSVFRGIADIYSGAKLGKLNKKVTGVMALTENAFGASSYKPGDVLKAANGKTVQVVDTDAEGRLALADGLAYLSKLAVKDQPHYVIDLATLTGSIVSALGEQAAGAMTNDEEFLAKLNKAFSSEGERLWHMPLFEEYKKLTKSSIADLAHCSSRPDAQVAGMFLQNFIPEKSKWVHLDIAGMGFIEEDGLFAYKGATGFGVKGLLRYLT